MLTVLNGDYSRGSLIPIVCIWGNIPKNGYLGWWLDPDNRRKQTNFECRNHEVMIRAKDLASPGRGLQLHLVNENVEL